MPFQVVLASASPRRLELLRQIGIEPDEIIAPEIDEAVRPRELPRQHAARLASEKLSCIQRDAFVVAADTVVAAGARILCKTDSAAEAERYLRLLSGRRHRVFTGIAIREPNGRKAERVVTSIVGFARLDEKQIANYIASQEWLGKAGGYAIQGRAAAFIDYLSGSYSNVVGLPLFETANLLRGMGFAP